MRATVIALFALVAVASAQQFAVAPIPISNLRHIQDPSGQYSYTFSTPHSAVHTDRGVLRQAPEGLVLVKDGTHEYTSPEGIKIRLEYYADETGYHPTGAHLPVAVVPIV